MSDQKDIPVGWQTESGLALDDADVKILHSQFRYDADYNNGETLLWIPTFEVDGEEKEQFFPCGKGWEPADKGQSARHESGKPRKFNKNSSYGTWLNSAIACAADVLYARGDATNAAVWEGLRFHVESHEESFTIKGELEPRTTNRIVATAYLGADEAEAKPAPKKSEKAAAKSTTNGDGELSAPMKAKLKAMAKEHDTHDAFMEAAFGLEGVMGVPAAENAVMDPDGLYAEARG